MSYNVTKVPVPRMNVGATTVSFTVADNMGTWPLVKICLNTKINRWDEIRAYLNYKSNEAFEASI